MEKRDGSDGDAELENEWQGLRTPVNFRRYQEHLRHRKWLAEKTQKQQDFEDTQHFSYWSVPKGWTEKAPDPGPKTFHCPGCDRPTEVHPVREEGYWTYYGGCAQCWCIWVNLRWAFRRPTPKEPMPEDQKRHRLDLE